MSRVFVIQQKAEIDITPAEQFGELVICLKPGRDFHLDPDKTTQILNEKLRDYGPDDFLLLMGDPVAIGVAAQIASQVNKGSVRYLLWMRRGRYYKAIRVGLPHIEV